MPHLENYDFHVECVDSIPITFQSGLSKENRIGILTKPLVAEFLLYFFLHVYFQGSQTTPASIGQ